jgi:phosphoribosylformylglycinamidine synthase
MRIKGTHRGLAMALDGNERWCYLDPKLGAMHAVAEAARKVACTGAKPVAATNCLNFGNPEKPEIMAQLSSAIDGISAACLAFETPITGGNVSLYNETRGQGIYPTPVIGIVGILEQISHAVGSDFQRAGDAVLLIAPASVPPLEERMQEFGSSEYARKVLSALWGTPPSLDLQVEASLHRLLAQLAEQGLIHSARDISDGGIAVALAEGCFRNQIGVRVNLNKAPDLPAEWDLFGETASQCIVSCPKQSVTAIEKLVGQHQGQHRGLMVVTLGETVIDLFELAIDSRVLIQERVSGLRNVWAGALPALLRNDVPVGN